MTKVGQGTFAAIITPPLSKSPLQAPLTSTRQNLAPFLEPARRIQYNLVFLLLLLLFSILGMLIKNYRKRSWYHKRIVPSTSCLIPYPVLLFTAFRRVDVLPWV